MVTTQQRRASAYSTTLSQRINERMVRAIYVFLLSNRLVQLLDVLVGGQQQQQQRHMYQHHQVTDKGTRRRLVWLRTNEQNKEAEL